MTQKFLITMLLLYLNMLITLQQCLLLVIKVIRSANLVGHGLKRTTCLAIRKNVNNLSSEVKATILNITPYLTFFNAVVLFYWGVTIHSKFRAHVNLKLIKANKCLHVLRTLRKEQYSQAEIDHLFTVLVSPNFIYGLPAYGASEPDRNIIQNILDRCHKRRFISYSVSIKDLLKNQDGKIFKKVTSINNHPTSSYIPSKKVCSYNLRKKQCARPKINTEPFMSAFVFKYFNI